MAENLEDINLGEALEPEAPSEFDSELATVSEVDGDGISLIFDGEDQSGGKKYKLDIARAEIGTGETGNNLTKYASAYDWDSESYVYIAGGDLVYLHRTRICY